ncbi:hypothetical protein SAMN04515674_104265 [Pseudarcicella hirudinis]|uniref:Uncharacterized protein n=1 Tax=Pseudarcicella hirudinis TaxID=1079859 RepID=A0A1I5RVI8_9BACT|nr:hypothetical protein [Pseudarcicella hirudinis]SFP62447.1 hypothetical protein SAMN04515674_104265 [Pseudarcicella hirudinis]
MKKSRNNGIHNTTSPKVSQKLLEKINKEAEEYEDGKAGVIREALTEYFFPEPVEISIPEPEILEERTYTIQSLVGLDVAHALNNFSHQKDVGIEVISGSILTDFVNQRWKSKKSDPDSEIIEIPAESSDLREIRKLFETSPDTMAWDDFLIDLLRAGILQKNSENHGNPVFKNPEINEGQIEASSSLIINYSEIESEIVRESLKTNGFQEDRYLTTSREIEVEAKFSEILKAEISKKDAEIRAFSERESQSREIKESFIELRKGTSKVIEDFVNFTERPIWSKMVRINKTEIIRGCFPTGFWHLFND